jgi:iron complex outermembrane receptor protein
MRATICPALCVTSRVLLPLLTCAAAWAQDATSTLAPVVVTATRVDAAAFDVPASIDRVDAEVLRNARAQVNLSEGLGGVAGLLARDRQNYAQDVQISIRGFGARSTFGIRGVRVFVDGIPATLPDGQGQVSHIDLASVEHLEVLRGPFSALYGNASGGVLQVFSEEGRGPPRLGVSIAGGSDGALRIGTTLSGSQGTFGYAASASRFTTDGYREHSAAERGIGNLKLTWRPDEATRLTVIANSVALPKAQDPMGLTRAQFETDPRGVDPSALTFDTRKTVSQTQGGLIAERRVDAVNSLRLLVYAGQRDTEQFQAIPVATQANPNHPGGVISLGRDYSGTDLRWTAKTALAERPVTLIAGLAYDTLREHRVGLLNYVGSTLGVEGALRRDEVNDVSSTDPYLQASVQLTPAWSVNAGVRHSSVRFRSTDAYIVGANPDDSGAARYAATLPVLGLMFAANDGVHLYATAGRGVETPTLNELAYRPGGATGLNFDLRPARSDSVEFGVKTRTAGLGNVNAAVFATRTREEIVTLSNVGGRATYQNAGSTRRTGLELSWDQRYAGDVQAQAAWTLLDARYREAFATCASTPCATPTLVVPAGNRIPGTARSALFVSLGWAPPQGWRAGVEARWLGNVEVNDANSDAAAGGGVLGAHAGYLLRAGAWEVSAFVRGDNLLGRTYAGSVIVNEGNGRYFEPAPGRTWLAGVSGSFRF